MTPEASQRAVESNRLARLEVIAGAHHHLPLERPEELAKLIEVFAAGL
jgi:pimeloyl-ACP methyl ester carboxylesterase